MLDNLRIFIAAHHNNFDESVFPFNDMYYIIHQNELEFKHKTIYLNDSFTKKFSTLYSEGCAMHFLYKNPKYLKEYVVFYQYGKYFINFFNHEEDIISLIDKRGCLVSNPWIHHPNNYQQFCCDVSVDVVNVFLDIINQNYPEYSETVNEWKECQNHYCFNIFSMKKTDYLEMCEFCFTILYKLAKHYNLNSNNNIFSSDIKVNHFDKTRILGYFLEHLTHMYYKYKFKDNIFICSNNISGHK